MSTTDRNRMGPTRVRDLVAVGVVAAAIAYAITRYNYNSFPTLPRLAGLTAAVIGIGEAIVGAGLRSRIRDNSRTDGRRPERPPVPPLTAARALQAAKASALAGAALAGLWLGFGIYVAPAAASQVTAAGADSVTAIIGLVCAGILLGGALFLEYCCRSPDDAPPEDAPPGASSGR